jgi:DNA-binding response OmpR family regulator
MAKVLVIDDDARIRRLVNRILSDARHQVIEAGDGVEGIKKFLSDAPDIVITDILMPEKEGIATIREIRSTGSKVGIIAMSGSLDGTELYLKMAGQLGADAVLPKPFRAAELIEVFNQVLSTAVSPS